MDTKTIIQKYIEREERYIADADERRDVDDHKWHRAKKQAFEEIAPTVQSLLDENERMKNLEADFETLKGNYRQLLDENTKLQKHLESEQQDLGDLHELYVQEGAAHREEVARLQADKAIAVTALGQIARADNSALIEHPHEMASIAQQALERIERGEKNARD